MLEPISLLGGIAAQTERIEIGTLDCVLPLRNPVFLAKAISTLDCIAKGRLLFGVSEEAPLAASSPRSTRRSTTSRAPR